MVGSRRFGSRLAWQSIKNSGWKVGSRLAWQSIKKKVQLTIDVLLSKQLVCYISANIHDHDQIKKLFWEVKRRRIRGLFRNSNCFLKGESTGSLFNDWKAQEVEQAGPPQWLHSSKSPLLCWCRYPALLQSGFPEREVALARLKGHWRLFLGRLGISGNQDPCESGHAHEAWFQCRGQWTEHDFNAEGNGQRRKRDSLELCTFGPLKEQPSTHTELKGET